MFEFVGVATLFFIMVGVFGLGDMIMRLCNIMQDIYGALVDIKEEVQWNPDLPPPRDWENDNDEKDDEEI